MVILLSLLSLEEEVESVDDSIMAEVHKVLLGILLSLG